MSNPFDQVLGKTYTRRGLLKGLAGGGLAALFAAFGFGVEEAEAGRCERSCKRRFDQGTRRRRRCLNKSKQGGGSGGGGTTNPQPVSTNPTGAGEGSPCTSSDQCLAGTTCFNSVCTACSTQCPTGSTTTCCAAGICQVLDGRDVCVLGG